MIDFLDLKAVNNQYVEELKAAAAQVIDSGWYLLGNRVRQFENELSRYCGVSNAVAVANGLDALRLILRAYMEMGIFKEGDEIIVPSNTYIATILAVTDNNLKPILVEPSLDTYNLDISKIKDAITKSTKAIIVVHLYGRVCWSDELTALSKQYDLKIIEDNAQSFGAEWRGIKTGALGDAAAFSFYPGKNLGALGDSGAVASSHAELLATVKTLANYGSHKKYENKYKGINSRMDEIQAAFLSVKLKYIDSENNRRRDIATSYIDNINNKNIITPNPPIDAKEHVWHLFVIRSSQRNSLKEYLLKNEIQTLIHYPIPPHKQEAYKEWTMQSYPISEMIHNEVLSIPINPIMANTDVEYIIDRLNAFKPE